MSSGTDNATEELRHAGKRIEETLDELHGQVGPVVAKRIDELVQGLVQLYGGGLSRLLDHAFQGAARPEELREAIAHDELVASLLLLHGRHPLPAKDRLRRALDRLRPVLTAQSVSVEIVSVEPPQLARLRVVGANDGRHRPLAAIRAALTQAVEEAAPELHGVEIEGLGEASAKPQLVQLRTQSKPQDASTVEASP